MREHSIPDVSLGTHFLNDLVEMDMLYVALRPDREPNRIDTAFFESAPNALTELLPDAGRWAETVRVIRAADLPAARRPLRLLADARGQRMICHSAGADTPATPA